MLLLPVSVVKKCECSIGCVLTPVVLLKSASASRRILLCSVGKEGPRANASVELAFWLLRSENKPTAVLYVPAVRLRSALQSLPRCSHRDNRRLALG